MVARLLLVQRVRQFNERPILSTARNRDEIDSRRKIDPADSGIRSYPQQVEARRVGNFARNAIPVPPARRRSFIE